ncbi:MAG TPA: VCBS repeat-containing protein [Gaiellaceae bacterium]
MAVHRLFLIGVVLSVLCAVPAALAAPATVVTGADAGWPDVRGWTSAGAQARGVAPWGPFDVRLAPYSTYREGVRVAVGDVTGDGKPEIVTAPAGGWFTEIRVFDGKTFVRLAAYPPFKDGSGWQAGAFVAVGDTTGAGRGDVVVGLDRGCCTSIRVLQGGTGLDRAGFYTYGSNSDEGVRVAAADVNGDGKAEIIGTSLANTGVVDFFAPAGGMPFRSITAFPAGSATTIAAGDVLGTARPELVAAAATFAGVQVKVFDVQSGDLLASLSPFAGAWSGAQVATADVNGDGRADVVVDATSASGTQVKAFDVASGRELTSFFVLEPGIVPAASLAAGDLDGDGKAEIVLGGGPTETAPAPPANGPDQRVVVYRADGTRVGGFSAYDGLFQGGVRVALGDVNGDGTAEVATAPGPGMPPEIGVFSQDWANDRDRGTRLAHFLAYEPEFRGGVSVAIGHVVDGGAAQIVAAPGPGRPADIRVFDANGALQSSFRAFEDSYTGGVSVAAGDLDADGTAEVVVGTLTGPARVRVFRVGGGLWLAPVIAPFGGYDRGVEVAVADLDGTGRGLVLVAQATGSNPLAALVDPFSGTVTRYLPPLSSTTGLRVAAGDIDGDGGDEIVHAPGWGGDGVVHVLDANLQERLGWLASGAGYGYNVAVRARNGLPIRSESRTVEVRARRPTSVIIARFVDASTTRVSPVTATVAWPDGAATKARVVRLDTQVFGVRLDRTYKRPGTLRVTVTLSDGGGRRSIAHSTVVVRRR